MILLTNSTLRKVMQPLSYAPSPIYQNRVSASFCPSRKHRFVSRKPVQPFSSCSLLQPYLPYMRYHGYKTTLWTLFILDNNKSPQILNIYKYKNQLSPVSLHLSLSCLHALIFGNPEALSPRHPSVDWYQWMYSSLLPPAVQAMS